MTGSKLRMTNREAIKDIRRLCETCKTLHADECNECFYPLVIEALEKADKYRWHDLRKNPDDLPNRDCDLLAVRDCMGLHRQAPVNFSNGTWFDCIFNETAEDIIAWREIEPFEEA